MGLYYINTNRINRNTIAEKYNNDKAGQKVKKYRDDTWKCAEPIVVVSLEVVKPGEKNNSRTHR
jgi:hypothetical protein